MIQTSQTPRIRFCRQNVDTLDNPQDFSFTKFQHLLQCENITFDPNKKSKIWQQNRIFGFQNPAHKISEQSTFR